MLRDNIQAVQMEEACINENMAISHGYNDTLNINCAN